MTIAFDTLDYARKLESAGVPIAQAEQQSKLLANAFEKSVASQIDLTALEQNITAKIEKLEVELKNDLALLSQKLGSEMTLVKWMFGAVLTILVPVGLKLFTH